jgi:hypothetical protein
LQDVIDVSGSAQLRIELVVNQDSQTAPVLFKQQVESGAVPFSDPFQQAETGSRRAHDGFSRLLVL